MFSAGSMAWFGKGIPQSPIGPSFLRHFSWWTKMQDPQPSQPVYSRPRGECIWGSTC